MSERRIPLQCPSNHWGYASDAIGTYEARCKSKYCRTSEGSAVIHVFDLATGSFVTRVAPTQPQAVGPEEHHHARNTAV